MFKKRPSNIAFTSFLGSDLYTHCDHTIVYNIFCLQGNLRNVDLNFASIAKNDSSFFDLRDLLKEFTEN